MKLKQKIQKRFILWPGVGRKIDHPPKINVFEHKVICFFGFLGRGCCGPLYRSLYVLVCLSVSWFALVCLGLLWCVLVCFGVFWCAFVCFLCVVCLSFLIFLKNGRFILRPRRYIAAHPVYIDIMITCRYNL